MKPDVGLGIVVVAGIGLSVLSGLGLGCARATELFGDGSASGGEGGAGGGGEGGTSGVGVGGFTSGTSAGGSGTTSSTTGSTTSSTTGSTSSTTGGAVCGDGICSPTETCQSCSADCCPPTCAHDVCVQGAALTSGCSPCATAVCNQDSFCCTDAWDDLCVGAVPSVCGIQCPGGTCSHPLCSTGVALISGCDPCVTSICQVDPFCCTTSWDSVCVGEVGSVCGMSCSGSCVHDKCVTGAALTSGCDPCVTSICQVDSFCCSNSWDSVCVGEVGSVCGLACP